MSFWKRFLGLDSTEYSGNPQVPSIEQAASALLLEVAYADDEFSDTERRHIQQILQNIFKMTPETAAECIEEAEALRQSAIDIWQFTNQINQVYTKQERRAILTAIWQVIFSDGKLDQHEDYLVHKIATLLRLQHDDLIEAKLQVKYRHSPD